MLSQKQIDLIIQQIATGYQPEKIYLFGSYATGKANQNSDIDLFIVKDTDKRKIERNREVRRSIKDFPPTGVDIVVFTPSELKDGCAQTMNIGKEAVTTGRLMYERI